MMKQVLYAALVAMMLPAAAGAEYVCGAAYYPYVQNTVPGRLRVRFTASPSCTGASRTLWFCDNRFVISGTTCAGPTGRYDSAELLALFQQAARAADSQQKATAAITTCSDNVTVGCGYSVDFGE
jgi:hypothetical protein